MWIISRDNDYITYKVYSSDLNSSINKDNDKPPKLNKKRKIEASSDESDSFHEKLLVDYFRLNTSLKELYDKWSEADTNFRDVSDMFYGIRIMKQDPIENIFSFICSSNNFISR